jgi:hypothetical protein
MEPEIFRHSKTFGAGGKPAVEEHLVLEGLARYEWMQGMTGRLLIKHSSLASDSKGQGCLVGNVGIMAMLDVEQMRASCH